MFILGVNVCVDSLTCKSKSQKKSCQIIKKEERIECFSVT